MQTAKNGDTVLIEFVVRTNDGRVVGNTERDGPQTVKIGRAEVFPQIDAALNGMTVGAEQTVAVAAADAFGPRREEMVIQIPRESLPQDTVPQPGMQLSASQQDGSTLNLVITEVGEQSVTADGNHPLAGEDLFFGLTIVEIKDAA
ncbi:FKBP-type peptidyl-prolyl cis-trans isomerase [Novosphingobium album (ex Hu et al. 2023)]|uniref:Peptidyl-prolyl cis-trans isomerase n=1 Tax=Novosphingobium album (ex Hu et al. 2023) TaxID=2930093 RepID=A0ABT0B271_9SPHN|nr:FKBP-type peptidyl-prolyl cis-trans isomerase [Novosphingobium album (ex Hu et al. 2023)]MCJ2178983.1 FKBP-type peptidyl-prolyl cis-trans isomerase [Novosphingobium album (ex Hu et al. 2023)]